MIDTTDRAGDIDTLRALKEDDDPRTIPEMKADDPDYEEGTIERVTPRSDDGGWEVMYANGTCLGCPRIDGKPEPKEGDTIRVYGQLGRPFYGIDLNGVEVFWRTPWERFARRVEMLAGFDREHRERFEQNRDAMDRRYDALPAVLKARIDRFRSERADFRIDSEAYEMAAVGDAPKIARALAGREGWKLDDDLRAPGVPKERIEAVIQSFMDENYERQKELVPDLDEGHSGNTFGGAVRLAYALLAGEGV